jgi:hypothetical protein
MTTAIIIFVLICFILIAYFGIKGVDEVVNFHNFNDDL